MTDVVERILAERNRKDALVRAGLSERDAREVAKRIFAKKNLCMTKQCAHEAKE